MKFRGLRRRWLRNGIALIALIILAAVVAFSLSMYSYYYTSLRTGLEEKAKTSSSFFSTYVSGTYAEYQQSAYLFTGDYGDKDQIELQFINVNGRVETSSYGLGAGVTPGTPDIQAALDTGVMSAWQGTDKATGEQVMAVSAPILYSDGGVMGAMRYVTSLRLVNREILQDSLSALVIGALVLAAVVLSNFYFLRTITEPIRGLTAVARRIAEGSYGIQAEKKYDDEIGLLTDAVNEMSAKVGQAEKMQTEFISSVSHELRTPLTAITGWSETLLYDESLRGETRRGLTIISREAGRLTKMVEDLLEFTRVQDGRFHINAETMDLEAELEDIVFSYGELLRAEHVELEYVPPQEEIPPIQGDPERLKQVFLNILDNAAKYGREGKLIVVSLVAEGESVSVRVRDFGPGIPENELPFVKRKFYKGSSKERGSGIGLAICEEIVALHRGELTIENAQGGGVLVTVTLPTGGGQAAADS